MTNYKTELGQRGEEAAACFLERQGYEVVERNYRCSYGEIDIIARKDGVVAFVEVKTRTSLNYDSPAAAVNYLKQQKIRTTALTWLQTQERIYEELSFDVVEIMTAGTAAKQAKLRWLKGCF